MPRFAKGSCFEDHRGGRVELGRHVGEAKGHGLVLRQRLAEGGALLGVQKGVVQCRSSHAHTLCGDADAAHLEVRKSDAIPVAFVSDEVARRNLDCLEAQLRRIGRFLSHLVLERRDGHARRASRNEKRGDAALARRRVGDGEHDHCSRDLTGGDELLRPRDLVAAVGAHRASLKIRRIGPSLWLRERERPEHLSRGQGLEVLLFEHVTASRFEDRAHRSVVEAHDRRHGTITCRDLDQRKRIRNVVQARSAPAFGDRHAHEPELPHLAQDLGIDGLRCLPSPAVRRQSLLGESGGRLANQLLLFGENHACFVDKLARFRAGHTLARNVPSRRAYARERETIGHRLHDTLFFIARCIGRGMGRGLRRLGRRAFG